MRLPFSRSRRVALFLLTLAASVGLASAQPPSAPAADPSAWTTAQDHANMLAQLGITQLRPGPSGRADAPNAANYDPAKANPFPDLPELLVAKNGTKITTPEQWWKTRHPEILADFEREVIGRVPAHVPKVTWLSVCSWSWTVCYILFLKWFCSCCSQVFNFWRMVIRANVCWVFYFT